MSEKNKDKRKKNKNKYDKAVKEHFSGKEYSSKSSKKDKRKNLHKNDEHSSKSGSVKKNDVSKRRKDMIIGLMSEKNYVPMKEKELAIFLQVKKKDREEFSRILTELVKEGSVSLSKRGKYSVKNGSSITGVFRITQHGFGFVQVEGYEEEFYIPVDEVNGAMHLDTVEIVPIASSRGNHITASIVNVISRASDIVVGTFDKAKNHYGFVIPDNTHFIRDIFIPLEHSMGAVDGHKVVAKLIDYGSETKSPEGRIIEILGHANDPGVDILSIIKGYNIPTEFPERVLNQANKVPDEVIANDYFGRLDLRDLMMVTIDSKEAKDLDDAVSLYTENDNYVLGVHIADVTNYVQEHSALDKEAYERGTSVYLVDRVIPMLPHKLSNGICSLNEGVDRLTLSCIMTIDKKGNLIDHTIAESVINTNKRMTYTDVNAIIEDGDEATIEKYKDLTPMFLQMKELSEILRKKRAKRGGVDFDLPETKIILDEEGHVKDIAPYERNLATRLIEDFMLMANETVAKHFCERNVPFVYRIHEKPDIEKIRKLDNLIHNFNLALKIKNDEIKPAEIASLLEKIKDTPQEMLVSRLALRSMQRAKYSTECSGHFGLACDYYCHFTSPIRRYPDLQIHRIIKEELKGKKRHEHYEKILEDVAKHSSEKERTAQEAERETDKLKKAEYMQAHIGETFEGVISGVTNWGIYVELPNTVEGLVHISKMEGDYFYFNEENYELVGEMTRKRYTLGQKVAVVCNSVDMSIRAVDFVLDR